MNSVLIKKKQFSNDSNQEPTKTISNISHIGGDAIGNGISLSAMYNHFVDTSSVVNTHKHAKKNRDETKMGIDM